MLLDYFTLGGVEVANHARLATYLETVGSPLTSATVCKCETFTAATVGDLPYTTPTEDGAPWYDPDVPESADFAGLLVLSMEGLDAHPVKRSVTNAVTGGGSFGPARAIPRTITVTAVLLGATCCAVEYGLHWLAEVLTGCTSGECDGDCLTLFNCCPGAEEDPGEFEARHRRSLRRVALVDGPEVTARQGDGCATGTCQSGADVITVEFTLSAATPWLYTDTMPVLEVDPPVDTSTDCVTWCLHGTEDGCGGTCRLAACEDPTAACADPLCRPTPPPSITVPETCYCLPLAVEKECWEVDLTGRPSWSVDVPVITIRAGSGGDLRNLTLTFYQRTAGDDALSCEEMADLQRCNPHSVYHVRYLPAGGALTLDGQINRAVVECGGVCETSPDVYGRDGLPPSWRPLDCATYCLCIESDVSNPPPPGTVITVGVSGRGW
ncbi:hypothetical protein ACFC09_15620 [Streptomyces sp. NPDC056161]|uniref:hypothetical protein n=1 Tax=Streptomyces sp. NPDC056161 TaxID=3345732 RepID=UPI0035D7C58A